MLSGLIVGGAYVTGSVFETTSEVVPSIANKNCRPPSMPLPTYWSPSLILTPNQEILLCGGKHHGNTCMEMKQNNWEIHSKLNEERNYAASVSMPNGVFIFGGTGSDGLEPKNSWEWLPRNTKVWRKGGFLASVGFSQGCAVKASDNEIVLIGGMYSKKTVVRYIDFNLMVHLDNILKVGRWGHSCVSFNDKIIVSGGYNSDGYLRSVEVLEYIGYRLLTFKLSSSFIEAKAYHGLLVAPIQNKLSVLALGGYDNITGHDRELDSIEILDPTTFSWTLSNMKLSRPNQQFGYATVPTHLVCS